MVMKLTDKFTKFMWLSVLWGGIFALSLLAAIAVGRLIGWFVYGVLV